MMIQNLVQSIVGGFNGILNGLGSGVADFFKVLFLENTGTASNPAYDGTLSTFASVALVLMGVGIAIGIGRWVIRKVGR